MNAHREPGPGDRYARAPVSTGSGLITGWMKIARPLACDEGGGPRSENGDANEGNEGKCDGG